LINVVSVRLQVPFSKVESKKNGWPLKKGWYAVPKKS